MVVKLSLENQKRTMEIVQPPNLHRINYFTIQFKNN